MIKRKPVFLIGFALVLMLSATACIKVPNEREEYTAPIAESNPENSSVEVSEQSDDAEEGANSDVPSLKNFKTTDLDGNEITQEIFSNADLTMINIWATYCNPCLSEMPDLGEISREYADKGVQMVGILLDVYDQNWNVAQSQIDLAKEIIDKTGADYLHLMPSVDLIYAELQNVQAVPTTIFVDKQGNRVGQPHLGAKTKENWEKEIEARLEMVNNEAASDASQQE